MAREACECFTDRQTKPKNRHSIVCAFECAGKSPCESLTVYMRRTRKAMEDIDAASYSACPSTKSQMSAPRPSQPASGTMPQTGEDPATR